MQERPALRQKIKAYEYKIKNQEYFDQNNIRIDDLIKLNISKPDFEYRHITIDDIQNDNSDYSKNYRYLDLNGKLDSQLDEMYRRSFRDQLDNEVNKNIQKNRNKENELFDKYNFKKLNKKQDDIKINNSIDLNQLSKDSVNYNELRRLKFQSIARVYSPENSYKQNIDHKNFI